MKAKKAYDVRQASFGRYLKKNATLLVSETWSHFYTKDVSYFL